jgi:autotransporter translocation and assembly factor TamB
LNLAAQLRIPQRWQRIVRVIAVVWTIMGTVMLVATVGAWRYARSPAGRARLAALAQKELLPIIPGLRVRELGRGAGGELIAAGVDIWDAEGRRAVHVDQVRVRPHWTSLLRQHVRLEEVRLEGVRILGRASSSDGGDRRLNLATLLAPRGGATTAAPPPRAKETDHLPIPVHIERLVVTDLAADVWAGGGAPHATVDQLSFEARLDSEGRHTSAVVPRLEARGNVDERPFRIALTAHGDLTERRIEAVLDALSVAGVTPEGTLDLRAGVSGELAALKVWLKGTGPSGAAVAATGSVELEPARYDLRLTGDAPALRALFDGAPDGGVALQVQARGHGTPLQDGSAATIEAYVPRASVAGHAIDAAYVRASSTGRAWQLERADAHAPGIAVHAEGTGEGPRVTARATVDVHDVVAARRTAGLRPAAAPSVPARGRGHLEAKLEGRVDERISFDVEGHARALAATVWGRLRALDLSVRGVATRGEHHDWTVAARGNGRLDGLDGPTVALASARFEASASASGPDAQSLQVGRLSFAGTRLRVDKTTFERITVQGRADRTSVALSGQATGRAGSATVAAHGRRRADRLDITLDRVELAVTAPGPRQRLTLARPARVAVRLGEDIQVADLDLRADGELLSGAATISATARLSRPPAGTPWARADIILDKLTTAGIPPITGTVHASADGRRAHGEVALRMGASTFAATVDAPAPLRASLGELRLSRTGRVELTLDSKNLDLASLPPLQRALSRRGLVGGRITVHGTVSGDIAQPDVKLALDVRALELRDVTGQGRDSVIHTIPGIGASVQISTAQDRIETNGKVFMYGAGVASFQGTLRAGPGALLAGSDPRQAPLAARVDIPRFQLNALKSLSDELRDTHGWLTGSATVSGTLAHPRGQAELTVVDARVDQLSVGRVVVRANADGQALRLAGRIDPGGQTGALTANAKVSLGADRTLDARIEARQFNPGVMRPFVTGVRELDGVVDAQVRASGALPAINLSGRVYAYRGRLGLVGQPTFRDVGLAASLRPGRLELEKLQMYSGDGSLEARGWMNLDGLRPRSGVVTGSASRFTIAAAGVSGARLDGAWAVEIAQRDSVLGGKVNIPHAAVWLPKLALGGRKPQRITPHDDVRFIDGASRAADAQQRAAAKGDGKEPLTVNVQAKARTVYVRGKDLDLELESAVTLKTPPTGGALQLLGSVRIRRGRINIQGQRFDVGTGAITFDGLPSNPRVDITLSRNYPEARVLVEIHGRPSKPELRLSSEPAIYDQGQIVSLILTGQAQGRPSGGGSFDPTATIATAVLVKLADKVAPEVGLDVIRIERAKPSDDAATTAAGDFAGRVEVGKYVNDRVYVSYAHRFGATERQNANEAHAEYRISAHWLAETVFGDAGVGGVDAFWIYRY